MARVIEYDSTVEIVFQGTNLDTKTYNLIDPPLRNTVLVPINGWATIIYRAGNPGMFHEITF
ncbi:hypothetical protein AHAS_Ahas18G0262700 [Arachis hypogaea]